MAEAPSFKPTDFDCIVGDRHLQMLKAALPYLQVSQQRFLSFSIKFQELQHTMSLIQNRDNTALGICSLPEEAPHSSLDMLEAIKPYGSTEEQDFIDLICNFIRGNRIGSQYQESQTVTAASPQSSIPEPASPVNFPPRFNFSFETLKNLLSGEQQNQLEHAMLLMQAIRELT